MRAMITLLALTPLLAAQPTGVDPKLLATAKDAFKDLVVETLPNDLKVVMLPIPGSPVVTTMTAYRVGSADESKDQTGLSHYLEHLLFKGTDKLVPGDIDRMTQRNGGRNNAYTNENMTVYHFDFAADRWMTALEIEADRMRNTRIDDKHEFQQEKGAVVAELKKYEDEPWDLESKALLPRLYGETPYGHPVIGEEQHVRGATAEIITRYYDKWYHPNNCAIVIVGGFKPEEALAKVKSLFGGIPKGELPTRPKMPVLEKRAKQVRHQFESKFDIARATIGFNGVVIGEPDDYTLDVLSELLTGGRTGRLYTKLILKEQLAGSISATNNAGRYPGHFEINMEVLPGKDHTKAEMLLFAEIKKLAEAPPTDAELTRVRRSMVASFIFSHESTHAMADGLSKNCMLKDLDYLLTYLDRVLAVTATDVQHAAKKYLDEQSAVVVWSLPAGEVKGGPTEKRSSPPRKTTAPGGGATSAVKLTDARRVVLPNGLTLIMLENHRLPIVVATAHVKDVRLREPVDKAGVATLMGSMLDEGTTKHSSEQIAEIIENVGGSLGFSQSGGSVKVLTPDTDLGMKLFFECLTTPSFPENRFVAMQEELVGEIAAEDAEPNRKALRSFLKIVYGDHPYGRPSRGTLETVEKITSDDCRKLHKALFVPNNTTLVVVGDFDSVMMQKKIESLTVDWKTGDLPKLAIAAPPIPAKGVEKIFSDRTAAQTHIYIGHLGIRRNDPDFYKLEVMDNVLGVGSGFTDRLSSTLRDRQGLAYTVRASITSNAGEEPGTFTGYIGTFPDKFTWVRDGFLKEIRRLREEAPTEEEVEGAKRYLLGTLPFQIETTNQIASELLMIEKYGLGFDTVEKYKAAILAVTPADVQAVAKEHLDPNKMNVVAVGPIDENGQPLKTKKKDGK